ncbi:nuclear matrix constituent protein 1 [Callorhinchus milii]|uniref:nuclear matrix constituent protein 1 n=1 Tax=Callorhinchus milii TaxID=7868 RepID=UPI001C3F6752|nr:nuclear matrix constituent protein 1 [Callorhinchus milii]
MMNQIVEGDLNYFKKNSPLLKEKMRLEDKLAEQAEHEVNEVTETLTNVLQELKQTKQSLDNAMSDANFERAVMQGQLDNLSKQLEEREKELRATENILDNFFNQEINTKYKLKEDEVALTNLHQKVSDLKFDAENLESNIEDWKAKSAEAKSETKIQNAICSELRQAIKFTRSAGDSELLKKKEEYRRKLNELEDMLNQSKQLQSEIENLSEKIKQSQDMKDKDDKEIHDKQTSIQNNNEQRNHLREQLTQVARLHNKVKIKMEQTKVEIKMQEQRSKIHIENLKRKIREEIGVRIKLQAKVLLDNAELDEFQNNANMKSATVMKGIKQAEKIVAAAESKFKKISDEHEKLHADYVSISSTYNKLQKRHQFIKEHLGKRRDRLQAQLTDDSEKLIKVSTELDNSLRRIKFLEEKLQELQLLSAEMSKQLGETHGMVKKLKRRLETTEFKFMNAQSTIRNLEKEFAHTKKRQKIINEEYHKLMLQRNETLKAMKISIDVCPPYPLWNWMGRIPVPSDFPVRTDLSAPPSPPNEPVAWSTVDLPGSGTGLLSPPEKVDWILTLCCYTWWPPNQSGAVASCATEHLRMYTLQLLLVATPADLCAVTSCVTEHVKLINACNKNNFLAEKYRRLQNTFLIAKTLLLEIYEERICIEVTLEDYKQLSLLESWMQKAVVEHFKRRGLYNQSVLAKLLSVSQENAKKIITVQGELSSSIQQISAFLLTLADSPVGSENIRNKHCIHHCVNEDKKSQAVQVTV